MANKSLIILYYPGPSGSVEEWDKRKKKYKDDLKDVQASLGDDYDFMIIEDPSRDKVETQVFFNPQPNNKT